MVFDGDLVAEPLVVDTVNEASALLTIPEGAATGTYGFTLLTSWGSSRFNEAFTVRSGAERPHVLDVEPDSVRQGDAETVVVTVSEPFAAPLDGGPIRVLADDDLVIVSDPVVAGERLTLDLVAAGGARPGSHTLVLDDGSRLWEVDLVIEERVYSGNTGCGGCNGAADGGPFAAWWLFLVLVRRRVKP